MDKQELNDLWDLVCDTCTFGELDYWSESVVYRTLGKIELWQVEEDGTRFGDKFLFQRVDLEGNIEKLKNLARTAGLRVDLGFAVLEDDFDSDAVDVMIQVAMLGEITYAWTDYYKICSVEIDSTDNNGMAVEVENG